MSLPLEGEPVEGGRVAAAEARFFGWDTTPDALGVLGHNVPTPCILCAAFILYARLLSVEVSYIGRGRGTLGEVTSGREKKLGRSGGLQFFVDQIFTHTVT